VNVPQQEHSPGLFIIPKVKESVIVTINHSYIIYKSFSYSF